MPDRETQPSQTMDMSLKDPLTGWECQVHKIASALCVLWAILVAATGLVPRHWKMDLKCFMVNSRTNCRYLFLQTLHSSGNYFDINVVDLWSSSSPWPLCNMPKSYFFLVKNPWLWRMSFRCSEPEVLHEALFTVRYLLASFLTLWGNICIWCFSGAKGYTAIVGRRFAQAFEDYKPHLIVSVHPLMQHVPVRKVARCYFRGSTTFFHFPSPFFCS